MGSPKNLRTRIKQLRNASSSSLSGNAYLNFLIESTLLTVLHSYSASFDITLNHGAADMMRFVFPARDKVPSQS